MNKDWQFKEGEILLIDKPETWTSFDAVRKVRTVLRRFAGITQKRFKVGHAGTLDPLATGLLVICTGKATKQIQGIQDAEKEYTGIIRLGQTTPSYDRETEATPPVSLEHLTHERVQERAAQFVGEQEQMPPIFSALRVNGKRAYEAARKGQEVELKARKINITAFELTKIEFPDVHFRLQCSKGTYVRSLAHDLGQALGVGGYLWSLRRTAIGDRRVENAISPDDFENQVKNSFNIA